MNQARSLSPSLPATTDFRASLRWPLLALLAVLLVAMAGLFIDRWRGPAAELDPATLRAGFGPANHATALAAAERNVVAARDADARRPGEWLRQEAVARALIARFRLAGDFRDLAEADRILDAALATTPDPAGPVLSKALLAVTTHRLDQADAALARFERSVAPEATDSADAAALAGDVALQRGDLAAAAKRFAEAERRAPGFGIGLRRAMLAASSGRRDDAIGALERLLTEPRQQPAALAALLLQRANLAYHGGDWPGAGRWIGSAQRAFPGWWLADAYAAQQLALAGREAEALRAYRIVAERSGRPEVMDALAHFLRLQGRGRESREWATRAAAAWAQRAALFPDAVAHHRAEHELAVGSARAALDFARADAAKRPQAPNLVLLARALLSAGQVREARAALDRADEQGWVSATQLMARSEVEAALGDAAASKAARERALAINPRAADPRNRLIWFGHD